jgi:hypothetical protein
MVWQNDLPIQKHKPSINPLKELIEVSGIFVIGSFSIKIWFHETATLWEKLRFKKIVVSFGR